MEFLMADDRLMPLQEMFLVAKAKLDFTDHSQTLYFIS